MRAGLLGWAWGLVGLMAAGAGWAGEFEVKLTVQDSAALERKDEPVLGGVPLPLGLVKDQKTKEPAADQAKKVRALCRENGVLVGLGGTLANVIRLQPPLVMTAEQADKAVDIVGKAITEAAK